MFGLFVVVLAGVGAWGGGNLCCTWNAGCVGCSVRPVALLVARGGGLLCQFVSDDRVVFSP